MTFGAFYFIVKRISLRGQGVYFEITLPLQPPTKPPIECTTRKYRLL
ncbi:hypothetical protein HPNQ4161_1640 [Helicobacter pylori NQ4161]|nr:hypothetical protein HPNQ4161_1640 [Helicobacter pylori NQ4161]